MKYLIVVLFLVFLSGCALTEDFVQQLEEEWNQYSLTQEQEEILNETIEEEPLPEPVVVPEPEPVVQNTQWRTDVCTIKAKDGTIRFQTKDIQQPRGKNRDGGYEWMITRVNGKGYNRLLIMSMYSGRRDPARIIFARTYHDAPLYDGRYPIPLMGVHDWEITSVKGALVLRLDGKEVWRSGASGYAVSTATMGGYPNRQMVGKWRVK